VDSRSLITLVDPRVPSRTPHAPLTHPSRTPHAPLTHPSRTLMDLADSHSPGTTGESCVLVDSRALTNPCLLSQTLADPCGLLRVLQPLPGYSGCVSSDFWKSLLTLHLHPLFFFSCSFFPLYTFRSDRSEFNSRNRGDSINQLFKDRG
jgi:hypothetical protein